MLLNILIFGTRIATKIVTFTVRSLLYAGILLHGWNQLGNSYPQENSCIAEMNLPLWRGWNKPIVISSGWYWDSIATLYILIFTIGSDILHLSDILVQIFWKQPINDPYLVLVFTPFRYFGAIHLFSIDILYYIGSDISV